VFPPRKDVVLVQVEYDASEIEKSKWEKTISNEFCLYANTAGAPCRAEGKNRLQPKFRLFYMAG
jgi:hypothetical protein